jgi:hypothetical protein
MHNDEDLLSLRERILEAEMDLPKIRLNGPIGVICQDGTIGEFDIDGLTVPDAAARLTCLGLFASALDAKDYVQFMVDKHAAWKADRH